MQRLQINAMERLQINAIQKMIKHARIGLRHKISVNIHSKINHVFAFTLIKYRLNHTYTKSI